MPERQGRALVLTSLGLEYAVRSWLVDTQVIVNRSGARYETGRLRDGGTWEVVLAEIGHGNQAVAAQTAQAIDAVDPDLVLFIGLGRSLIESVRLGDVVAATRVDPYYGGKQVSVKFLGQSRSWPASWVLNQAARQVRHERRWLERLRKPPAELAEVLAARPPEVHLGSILAGEVVVDSRESRLYRFVRKHYNDAVAIEMEGTGLASAANTIDGIPAMVVRGVSQLVDGTHTDSDAAGWQSRAARHAAAFAMELLAVLGPEVVARSDPRSDQNHARLGRRSVRPTPVVVDDAAGSKGLLGWFRALNRAEQIALFAALITLIGIIPTYLAFFADQHGTPPTTGTVPPPITIETVALEPINCSRGQSLKSTADSTETEIEFVNSTLRPIKMYWLNYDGSRELRGNLLPNESQEFVTYRTHPWLIADSSGACISVFVPTTKPGRAVLQD